MTTYRASLLDAQLADRQLDAQLGRLRGDSLDIDLACEIDGLELELAALREQDGRAA